MTFVDSPIIGGDSSKMLECRIGRGRIKVELNLPHRQLR
jgi:hypothetical protein